MEILTIPWYVINRGWERFIADDKGIISTENKEVIEVLKYLFPIKQEVITKPETKWKSSAKK